MAITKTFAVLFSSLLLSSGAWATASSVDTHDYVGCFMDGYLRIFTEQATTSKEMTPQFCKEFCDGQGFEYYGTQFGQECWCSSGTPEETFELYTALPQEACKTPCKGDATEKCGGAYARAVYKYPEVDAPSPAETSGYMGCFQDGYLRIFTEQANTSKKMTPQFCKEFCDGQGFDYYGTQFGQECWCSSGTPEETFELYSALPEPACNMPCKGDATEKCGGAYTMAVYKY